MNYKQALSDLEFLIDRHEESAAIKDKKISTMLSCLQGVQSDINNGQQLSYNEIEEAIMTGESETGVYVPKVPDVNRCRQCGEVLTENNYLNSYCNKECYDRYDDLPF